MKDKSNFQKMNCDSCACNNCADVCCDCCRCFRAEYAEEDWVDYYKLYCCDDYRSCEFANIKSMLKAYQEECSADAEKTRMLKEISKLPEHIVSERNGFKRSFLEKDTVINIIENLPFN